jgi:hypothetical protein
MQYIVSILLACIHSYLESALEYKFLILDISNSAAKVSWWEEN